MPERRRQAPESANIVRRGPSRMPMVLRSRSVGCRVLIPQFHSRHGAASIAEAQLAQSPASLQSAASAAGAIPRLRRHLDAELIVVRPGIEAGLRQAHMSVHDLGCSPIPGRGNNFHPPVQLAVWPDADHRSRIVFITRGIDRADLEASFIEHVVRPGSASASARSSEVARAVS